MMFFRRPLSPALLLFMFCWNSCATPEVEHHLFRAVPPEHSGVTFSNNLVDSDTFNIVDYLYYYNGGGVAIGDVNNDGLPDLYLTSNEGINALYLNLGSLQFQDITEPAGVASPGLWKTGVSMVDVNSDGLLDIYVCRLGNYKGISGANELYINNGDLTFTEESAKYNLNFKGFSTQAAFFDLENDGDLDVYLLNHSVHTPLSYGSSKLRSDYDSLAGDRLYENVDGVFMDISSKAGIYQSQIGYGLGIGLTDINNDDYVDIYISNDFSENDYFYINAKDGTFNESFASMATHTSRFSMGNDIADFNNDGLVDIMSLDMLPSDEEIRKNSVGDDPFEIFKLKLSFGYMNQYSRNALQLNRGDGTFSDIAMLAGVHATDWSWSALITDLNNDGLKDLFISNGIERRPNDLDYIDFISSEKIQQDPNLPDQVLIEEMPDGRVPNYLYLNKGDLTFIDQSDQLSGRSFTITNGAAYSDLDNDGDLDLVLNNLNEPATILENTSRNDEKDSLSGFLNLQLKGHGANTKAIGAKISVFNGDEQQFFEVFPVRGFQSSVDYRVHVGLGDFEQVDSLKITWPGGLDTALYEIPVNQFLEVNEASGGYQPQGDSQSFHWFEEVPSGELGVDFSHEENTFVEFNREPLIPHMNSEEGPALAVADINGDGLDDFFVGGAKHQAGQLYIQLPSGIFSVTSQPAFANDQVSEDVYAEFLDFDNDGDSDLLVVSGGNEFDGESVHRQPRLYLNDGFGSFAKSNSDLFSGIFQNGSCAAVADFNNDGWPDLFLGSLTVPWNYGAIPKSYLLINNEGKSFENVGDELLPKSGRIGMVNSAEWADMDGDGRLDLVLGGEWMGITILYQKESGFAESVVPSSSGWWKKIKIMDFDNDGDLDILGGNLGLNSKLKASESEPLQMYLGDFDGNGKLDQILTYYKNGVESIFPSKSDLTRQLVSIKKKFLSHRSYSKATPTEVFGKGLKQSTILKAEELRSGVYINEGKGFAFTPFQNELQISFIRDFLVEDINDDLTDDIIAGGNFYSSSVQQGWYNADKGALMLRGEGSAYKVIANHEVGLSLSGEVRAIRSIKVNGEQYLLIARNDAPLQWIKYNPKISSIK